jgi:hypothetical protein
MITFTLTKGTVVKIKGYPMRLLADVDVRMNEGNYELLFNHDLKVSSKPIHSLSSDTPTTSRLSSGSK